MLTVDEGEGAELVLPPTDHARFDVDLVALRATAVLDTRYRLSVPTVEQL